MKTKPAALDWIFIFTRPMLQTTDMIERHKLLAFVAKQIDEGYLRMTVNALLRSIGADNLLKAHAMIEQGSVVGMVVLGEWA